jgi:hypothetical protein
VTASSSYSVVLLGDSVFDNKAYTGGAPDVAACLREALPAGSRVTLCAIDGSTTSDLGKQLDRIPEHATHCVLSVGGNDALENADLLALPCESTEAALDLFAERLEAFEQSYGWALDAVVDSGRPVVVCTIYDAQLGGELARRAKVALMMFNDVILRSALARGVDVVDLRLVCRDEGDFVREIEPSAIGGAKIARAVACALGALVGDNATSRLSAG